MKLANILILGLLAGMTACSTPRAPEVGEPPLEAVTVTDVRLLVLPLDPYLVDRVQERLLERAKARLVIECLKGFGFNIDMPQALPPKVLTRNERRYGLTDETAAAISGYKVARADGAERQPEQKLTAEAMAVLRGTATSPVAGKQIPKGGCNAEGQGRLAEGTAGDIGQIDRDLAQRLSAEAHQQSEADSRVRAAFAKWSECMKGSGFSYKDPWGANDDPAFGAETATPAEIRTAVADVRCKKEANLIATWIAVDTAYQKRSLEKHSEGLQALKRLLDTELRNAAKLEGPA